MYVESHTRAMYEHFVNTGCWVLSPFACTATSTYELAAYVQVEATKFYLLLYDSRAVRLELQQNAIMFS